MHTSHL